MPFPVQYVGANPFDLAAQEAANKMAMLNSEAASRERIAGMEATSRGNIANMEVQARLQALKEEGDLRKQLLQMEEAFKERSPEYQWGREKSKYFGGATPGEKRQMMGLPSYSQEALYKGQADYWRGEGARREEEIKGKLRHEREQLEETRRAREAVEYYKMIDTYDKGRQANLKFISGLANKDEKARRLSDFSSNWVIQVVGSKTLGPGEVLGLTGGVIDNMLLDAQELRARGGINERGLKGVLGRAKFLIGLLDTRIRSDPRTDNVALAGFNQQKTSWEESLRSLGDTTGPGALGTIGSMMSSPYFYIPAGLGSLMFGRKLLRGGKNLLSNVPTWAKTRLGGLLKGSSKAGPIDVTPGIVGNESVFPIPRRPVPTPRGPTPFSTAAFGGAALAPFAFGNIDIGRPETWAGYYGTTPENLRTWALQQMMQ